MRKKQDEKLEIVVVEPEKASYSEEKLLYLFRLFVKAELTEPGTRSPEQVSIPIESPYAEP